jgi:hypothetical protein
MKSTGSIAYQWLDWVALAACPPMFPPQEQLHWQSRRAESGAAPIQQAVKSEAINLRAPSVDSKNHRVAGVESSIPAFFKPP